MKNLIQAELFKLKKSTAYKVLLITYLIIEAVIQMNNISNSIAYPKYNPTYTGIEWLLNLRQTLLYSIVISFYYISREWRFCKTYILYQPSMWHIA